MFKFKNLIIKSEFYKNYGYSKFDESFIDSLEKMYLESDVSIFEILLKIGTEKKNEQSIQRFSQRRIRNRNH